MMSRIPTKQGHATIDGREFDIVCSEFGNRLFVFISEYQKLGSLLEVTRDSLAVSPHHSSHTYSVNTLLGKDTAEVHVFGRAIASQVLAVHSHLLLALGLKEHTPQIIPSLLKELEQYKTT